MQTPTHPFLALEAWLDRRTAWLQHARAPLLAAIVVPLLCGLVSLCLGQDDNWDLKNYHWYNPYALLNGRLGIDMAPAQWQSYFNPLIDLPYYALSQVLPAPVVGFLMGWLHGLNFILLLAVVRLLLPRPQAGARTCILLASAGMCGAAFLSGLGNSMGDNLSALFVLGAIALVLRHWSRLEAWSGHTVGRLLLAGLVMGLGAGLKLTNATYAVALCVALLAAPASIGRGVAAAFTAGCGVLAGVALAAGPWWLRMWRTFGNPLFPQFNNLFKSPLAQQFAVIDDVHLPHDAVEALLWPFVFTRDMARVSELPFRQAILPVVYVLGIVFVCRWLFERLGGQMPQARLSPRARFLLLFGLAAYLCWLKLFSIYRYLVPLELLAPSMAWVLIHRLAPPRPAAWIGACVLALAALVVFPFQTWGHAVWRDTSFSAQFPPFARPASTIVFTAHGNPPLGWLATLLPRDVEVIALGSGFPESPAYVGRIRAAVAARPGPHYAMLAAAKNPKENGAHRLQALAQTLGMTAGPARCALLARLLPHVSTRVQVDMRAADGQACALALHPQYAIDLAPLDRDIALAARDTLARYGLQMDIAACRPHAAAVGAEPYPFRLCPVTAARTGPGIGL